MTPDDEFGFMPYHQGGGRLADAALARVKDDTWTKSDLRAAKWLRLKRNLRHPLRWLKRALRRSTKPSEG